MSHIIKVYATREGYEPPSIIVTVPRKQSSVSSITIVLVVQQNNQVQTTYTNSWSEQTIFGGTFDMVSGEALLLQYDGSYIRKQGTPNQIALTLGWNFISSAQGDVEVTQPRSVTGNSFSLDGVSSDLYGVGLSGTGVWDAPARKGESISVPGRNGNIWVDDGSFENILVTYPCWMSEDFAENVGDFRSFLSRHSDQYYKLTDTYNKNEYRLGRYAGAFTATPGTRNITGKFDVTFDCQPQRYLNSGAEWRNMEVVAPSEILFAETNPTGFMSYPVFCFSVSQDEDAAFYVRTRREQGGDLLVHNVVHADNLTSGMMYYYDSYDTTLRESAQADSESWETFSKSSSPVYLEPQSAQWDAPDPVGLYPGWNIVNNMTAHLSHFSIMTRYWTV